MFGHQRFFFAELASFFGAHGITGLPSTSRLAAVESIRA
jgi:hypothetical protein